MQAFKPFLKFIGLILTCLLGLSLSLSILIALLLFQPQWFINDASLRWASERVLSPLGVKISYDTLSPTFSREDFWNRSISVKGRAVRIEMENLNLELPSLSFQAAFNLHPQHFGLKQLGPLEALKAKLDMRSGPPDPTAKPFELSPDWVKRLEELKLEPIHVAFEAISFTPYQERPITTRLDARLLKDSSSQVWTLVTALEALRIDLGQLEVDLPEARAELAFKLDAKGILLQRLGPLLVDGRTLRLRLPEEPAAATASNPPSPSQAPTAARRSWPEQLKNVVLESSQINLKELIIQRPGAEPIHTELALDLSKSSPSTLNLDLALKKVKGLPLQGLKLGVAMQIPSQIGFMPLDARLNGQADLAKLGRARLDGDIHIGSKDEARYKLTAQYVYGKSTFQARSQGNVTGERFGIELSGDVSRPHPAIERIHLPRCRLSGNIGENRRPFLDAALDCLVSLTRVPTAAERAYEDLLPRNFNIAIQGPLTIPVWNEAPRFSAPIRVTLEELKGEVFQLSGKTDIELSGILAGPQQSFAGTATIDTRLSLASFQTAVKRFTGTDFSIPAPFNTLDGRVQCAAQGRIRLENQQVYLPVSCLSELDSSTQTLWMRADGIIQTRGQKKPLVQMDVNLEKVTIQLPKLSLDDPIPQILPDKRIVQLTNAALQAEPEPLPVELQVKITTPRGRPLQLSSHLLKRPIPIGIDLALTGDKPTRSGTVSIEDYDVDFLKKKAHVDHLKLILDPAIDSPALAGLLVFRDPDFRIDLKLSGTLAQPFYSFESQPPRSSSELLSMILFGGSPDSLDEDNLRSVEETRAAMVDGAVGLLSMYYLAATPIDSVGYNPHTGVFRARVRLGRTLSLTVGSDIEGLNQSVGMRKRLTENWSFETTAETDEESHENKGTAMFRWGRRY